MKEKVEDCQIEIPEPLITEVDKIVAETGLYSDKIDFVTDAIRRLVIDYKMEELERAANQRYLHAKGRINIENGEHREEMNGHY